MPALPDFKRGDTFILGCTSYNAEDVPQSLDGIAVRSQVRKGISKSFIAELAVTLGDQIQNPGTFTLSSYDTTKWPIGKASLDIEYRYGTTITSSQTIEFNIVRDITHD